MSDAEEFTIGLDEALSWIDVERNEVMRVLLPLGARPRSIIFLGCSLCDGSDGAECPARPIEPSAPWFATRGGDLMGVTGLGRIAIAHCLRIHIARTLRGGVAFCVITQDVG